MERIRIDGTRSKLRRKQRQARVEAESLDFAYTPDGGAEVDDTLLSRIDQALDEVADRSDR